MLLVAVEGSLGEASVAAPESTNGSIKTWLGPGDLVAGAGPIVIGAIISALGSFSLSS